MVSNGPRDANELAHDGENTAFLVGGGHNGALARATDWETLPLGPVSSWPQSLRTALDICLGSRFPMALYWGSDFVMLYNDDLLPMVGASKHPWAFGRPAREVLAEIWSILEPLLQSVVDTGQALWQEDLMLPMQRFEVQEEGYFTFTYSPVHLRNGTVGGVLCAVIETTDRIVEERRLRLLNDLASAGHAPTPAEACSVAAARIAQATSDVPFALFYLLDEASGVARLVSQANLEPGTAWSPLSISIDDRSVWPLGAVLAADTVQAIELVQGPAAARGAVILRIERAGGGTPLGFIVAGLGALLRSGESYARFHRLLAVSVSQSVSNAAARLAERDANQRLHALFFEAPVSVAVLRGPELRFELANPRYEQMVGRSGIEGKAFREAFPELADDAPVLAMLGEVYRSGRAYTSNEFLVPLDRTGSGQLEDVFFMFTCQPIRNAAGLADTILIVAVDVTQSVRLQRELENLALRERVARGQAEAASALKDEFLSTASHELRTPLNAILGWSRLLSLGELDASTAKRGVETIERNALAQVRLVEDILDGSRLITGKLRLDVRPLDLSALVDNALEAMRTAATAKQIEIGVAVDPAARHVLGDPDRLQQVIWNLLNNAIKFTARSGRVDLQLIRIDQSVELSVADTGEGISADFLPHIFERFRQADGSSTRRHGGLGLGLALVRHLVEAHGGTVRAQSEGVGRGSTFTVSLPVQAVFAEGLASERPPVIGSGSEPLLGSLKGVHALVVDDEIDARELVALVLSASGAEVAMAASADQAERLIAERDFDVLISDVGMPSADGHELIRRVRSQNGPKSRLPAVALTAYTRVQDRERALEAGFQVHVSKPVEPADLLHVVVDLLRRDRGQP